MGQTVDNKRELIKTTRFTKEEWETIEKNMQSEDYLSFSKYVRDLVLERKISRKTVVMTDRSIRNQVNDLTKKINKIGTNYNQVTKKYLSTCAARTNDGKPVINEKLTITYVEKLNRLTEEVKQLMNEVITIVSQINLTETW